MMQQPRPSDRSERRAPWLVGSTDLLCADTLAKRYGLPSLWLKSEGVNPSGSQKDRVAMAMVNDAVRRGFTTITVASCGNYGASLALFAQSVRLKAQIIIPASFHTPRITEMEQLGAKVVRQPGSYEECVRRSIEGACQEGWYDANPGGANVHEQLMAYSAIADELYSELGQLPSAVAFPVSNGTTLAGVHLGFKRLMESGAIRALPRLVAGSTLNMNPIVRSFREQLPEYAEIDPASVVETDINEPLINSHSFEGREALSALRESKGGAAYVTDEVLAEAAKDLERECGLRYIPAALAGVVALRALKEEQPNALGDGPLVAILTCAIAPIQRSK